MAFKPDAITAAKGWTYIQESTPSSPQFLDTWYIPSKSQIKIFATDSTWKSLAEFDGTEHGTIWASGKGTAGELGQNDIINRSSPVQVGSLRNWDQIYIGNSRTVAIKTDGTLWTWGYNSNGELGHGDIIHRSSPVQVGNLTTWKTAVISSSCLAAIKTDGTLWMCGMNYYGSLGTNNVVYRSSPIQVGALTTWSQVSLPSSGAHTIALRTDGTLWGWGYNKWGNLGIGVGGTTTGYARSSPTQVGTVTTWSKICCSGVCNHALALRTDSSLWAWGYNRVGQLGQGDRVHRSNPVQISGTWKYINQGYDNSYGIKTDGTLWAWGYGSSIGLSFVNASYPTQIGALTTWNRVMSAQYHTVATKTDDTIWVWGGDPWGALGFGITGTIATQTQVNYPYKRDKIQVGYMNVVGVT